MAKLRSSYNNVKGLNRALMSLPRLAADELRLASQQIASDLAGDARGAAMRVGGVAKYVAPTLKGTRDRVPVVKMGSSTRLPSTNRTRSGGRQTVGDVIWGAEYGGGGRPTTRQFRPFKGSGHGAGYFLWPTVRARSDRTQEEYSKALDTALGRIR